MRAQTVTDVTQNRHGCDAYRHGCEHALSRNIQNGTDHSRLRNSQKNIYLHFSEEGGTQADVLIFSGTILSAETFNVRSQVSHSVQLISRILEEESAERTVSMHLFVPEPKHFNGLFVVFTRNVGDYLQFYIAHDSDMVTGSTDVYNRKVQYCISSQTTHGTFSPFLVVVSVHGSHMVTYSFQLHQWKALPHKKVQIASEIM
ncbi:hypothetical protein TNCV_3657471 [Trichonephila clavipes]|nr:hypothetical protein TNCV_3657471 [Trichonephila clavipes]